MRASFRPILCVLVPLVLLAIGAAPAFAGDTAINVDTFEDEFDDEGDDCSLREAIEAANTNATVDGCEAGSDASIDTINVPDGTYDLTLPGDDDTNEAGDLDVMSDIHFVAVGGPVVIDGGARPGTITPEGTPTTICPFFGIEEGNRSRVLHVTDDGDADFTDFTFKGGYEEAAGSVFGGGILNNGVLDLVDSTVEDSFVFLSNVEGSPLGAGGGIANENGQLTLDNTTVRRNAVFDEFGNGQAAGGGIASQSVSETPSFEMEFSRVNNNSVCSSRAAGGGVAMVGPSAILGGRIGNNVAFGTEDALGGGVNLSSTKGPSSWS
jgi:CSLREA domain-containing protein